MEMRQIKGMEIARAKTKMIRQVKNGWLVQSQSDKELAYRVDEEFACTCPDSQKRKALSQIKCVNESDGSYFELSWRTKAEP